MAQILEKSREVVDLYNKAVDAWSPAVTQSEKTMRYLNHLQYTDDAIEDAEDADTALLTLNIMQPAVSVLLGNEQQNRRRGKIKPRNDQNTAAILQGRWNMINDEQGVEEMLQTIFVDGLGKRVGGWMERKFKMTSDGYLDFNYDIVNGFNVKLDPETTTNDYKLAKCRWLTKDTWMALDEIIDVYGDRPDFNLEKKVSFVSQITNYVRNLTQSAYSKSEMYDKENDTYKVIELQKRVGVKYTRFFDSTTGEYHVLPSSEWAKLKNPTLQKVFESIEKRIHITTVIPFFDNLLVQDEEAKWPAPNFSIFPFWSFEYNVKATEAACMLDLLVDVQDVMNKTESFEMDNLVKIVHGATFVHEKDEDTYKGLLENGNRPNQIYKYKNEGRKPFKLQADQAPQGALLNQQNAMNRVSDITLIDNTIKGGGGKSGESASLFEKKVQRAAAAINSYFANLSKARKFLLEDFIDNASYVYSEADRYIDVKNNGEYERVLINLTTAAGILNNVQNPSVYVELDEGEDNLTHKEDNFNTMMAMVNILAQYNPGLVDWVALVDAAPIDASSQMRDYARSQLETQMANEAADRAIQETAAATTTVKGATQ